jgi:hypothetical protein
MRGPPEEPGPAAPAATDWGQHAPRRYAGVTPVNARKPASFRPPGRRYIPPTGDGLASGVTAAPTWRGLRGRCRLGGLGCGAAGSPGSGAHSGDRRPPRDQLAGGPRHLPGDRARPRPLCERHGPARQHRLAPRRPRPAAARPPGPAGRGRRQALRRGPPQHQRHHRRQLGAHLHGAARRLGSRSLGAIGPGDSRTFRFTASLPEGGNNAYAGSGLTVGYQWTATATGPGGGGNGGADQVVKIGLRSKRLLTRGILDVIASCDLTCRVSAYGRRTRTKRRTATLAIPNRTARIRLKVGRKARRQLLQTLKSRRRTVIGVNVSVSPAAGGPARTYTRKLPVRRAKALRRR